MLYPVAVHYKGSGFYSTDYGRGSRKGAAKDGDSGSGEKSEGGDKKDAAKDSGVGRQEGRRSGLSRARLTGSRSPTTQPGA